MVILDIDQDFFFYPPLYKEDFENKIKREQVQVIKVEDFIKRYNLKGKVYTIFRRHDQAYFFIKKYFQKIDKLLHFDAHYDFNGFENEISIGNWVGHLVKDGICNDIDWITSNKSIFNSNISYKNTQNKSILGRRYEETFFDYDSHSWVGDVDCVLFTISYEFCPNMNVLSDFIENIN